MPTHTRAWFVVAALSTAACGASGKSADTAATTPAAQPAPAADARPATPVATSGTTPAASPAVADAAAPAPATAAAPAVTTPAAEAASPEIARKRAQIAWALKQDEIKNDPQGQWASDAKASSSYNDAQGTAAYSAGQATGAPDVETYGNARGAWSPKTPNAGIEWLELTYSKPVHATAIRVRESYTPGTVIKVEVFDEQGAAHPVWSGIDPTKDLDYLTVEFAKTTFKTARVKITLATNTVPGYKQIDAVQLVGTEQ
jgi:hypothetical protein